MTSPSDDFNLAGKTPQELGEILLANLLMDDGGDMKESLALVEHGADLRMDTGFTWGENTALHLALKRGQTELARAILSRDADPLAKTYNEETALMFAARRGDVALVEILLGKGLPLEDQDLFGRTALCYALAHPVRHDMIVFLLARGANPEHQDRLHRRSILERAQETNDTAVISLIESAIENRHTAAREHEAWIKAGMPLKQDMPARPLRLKPRQKGAP